MKKITIIAALAALAFTACEKNGQTPVFGTSEVRFVMDEIVTRVTTTDNATTFEVDDKIAITSEGLYEDIVNEEYTYTSTGLDGKSVLFNETGEASFVAHYPSSLNNTDGSIKMTVPAVQTAENFHVNMFMVATAGGNATDNVVTLQFAHQLAWVKVVLEGIDGTAVTLHGVKPTVTWTSSALEASDTETDITTWKQTDKQEYWALVPAQTISASTKLITVETATTAYEYTLTSELNLTTAKVKTITLSLDPSTGLTQASFSVDGANDIEWVTDTRLEDFVTEKPAEPLFLISAEDGSFDANTVFASGMNNYSGLTAGWNVGSKASVTVADGNVQIKVTDDAANARYNRGIAFKTAAIPEDVTTLELSFYAYCSSEKNLYVSVMQPEAQGIAFYINSAQQQTPTLSTTSTKYTYQIDLTSASEANAIYTNGVVVLIAPGNASNNLALSSDTWYVSDVILKEVTE